MVLERAICALLFACASAGWAHAQDPAPTPATSATASDASASPVVSLTVLKGTPLQVALSEEVRVRQVGQTIHGRIMQPVYAFDRLVIPVGTEVTGRITEIEPVSGKKRTRSALDENFSPAHKIEVSFDDLVMADGKHIPLRTVVTPGSGQVIELVSAGENEKKKTAKDAAAEKVNEAKQEAKRQWRSAMDQVRQPGKIHRLEQAGIQQLPIHPQYIKAATLYFAELQEPLDFGNEPLNAKTAATIGIPPPPGSLVHALLVTPLDSASTQRGAEVEAILSQPLFDGGTLILPQGSRLKGSVVQVRPARHMQHNGQLRIVFHELLLPDGLQEKVDASLEGVQSNQNDHVKLDTEGGAQATSPKTRYLSTAISLGLAAMAFRGDPDATDGDSGGNTNSRIAGGATGYKLVGMVLGLAVHSQPLAMAMGAYGAGTSVYSHFIARGRDVTFAKNTAMEVGFGGPISPSRANP